jgi:phosphonate transport system substrate-binding protein
MSQSGYGITRYHLVSIGETSGFFSEVVEAGFHETAIRMVRDGEVDASAIDSQVLSVAMRDDPSLEHGVKIIDSLGPSTIQPIAVTRRFTPQLREAIRSALVDVHNDQAVRRHFDRCFIERITPIGPEDYDDIRQMLEACEGAGFLTIR